MNPWTQPSTAVSDVSPGASQHTSSSPNASELKNEMYLTSVKSVIGVGASSSGRASVHRMDAAGGGRHAQAFRR